MSILTAISIFALATQARADDNVSALHWNGYAPEYRVHSGLSDLYVGEIEAAAHNWDTVTEFHPTGGSDIAHKRYDEESSHIWWRGTIPVEWVTLGCADVPATLACTRNWTEKQVGTSLDAVHFADADTIFNANVSMGGDCFGKNIETIATHEWGHWILLGESSDSGAAMFFGYTGCRNEISDHDDRSVHIMHDATEQCPLHDCIP